MIRTAVDVSRVSLVAVLLFSGCGTGLAPPRSPRDARAPRLVSPLSTASVSSQRPTLRWLLPSGTHAAAVEVCRDRACASVDERAVATGEAWRPSRALSSGPHFWRVRSVDGAGASATWELFVGPRDRPTDLSWGTRLDIDGDGFVDLATGAIDDADGGWASWARGGPSGPQLATALRQPEGWSRGYGAVAIPAGDIDGDGFADLAVLDDEGPYHTHLRLHLCPETMLCFIEHRGEGRRVFLYHGGPLGLDRRPVTRLLPPPAVREGFAQAVVGGLDLDGDGYGDLAVSAQCEHDGGEEYCVMLFRGGPRGLDPTPSQTLFPPESRPYCFGCSLAAADFDGDGRVDLAVQSSARTLVWRGHPHGFAARPEVDVPWVGSSTAFLLLALGAGDIDGDGYPDLVVGGWNEGAAVHRGGPDGPSTSPATGVLYPVAASPIADAAWGPTFAITVAHAGDVDGDGFDDLVVGESTGSRVGAPIAGRAFLYRGNARGIAPQPISLLTVDASGAHFGDALGYSGDVDGDGRSDVMVIGKGDVDDKVPPALYVFRGATDWSARTLPTWTLRRK